MNTFDPSDTTRSCGKVWLIGTGPGDPELLTLKAVRVLKECTVWLVDDLVGPEILDFAAVDTRIIHVGKRGGCISTSQDFILRLMARYARHGHTVARLKGGDPFIFGRGGEEMAWLNQRGIHVDSISGITAALAAGSALGLPLTQREVSRGVTLVTAHTVDGASPDWKALAQSGLTVVCYMGMGRADQLTLDLMAAGFPAGLPVAVIQRVSCASQRQIVTTLEHMGRDIEAHQLGSPAVIVLGEAVAHRQKFISPRHRVPSSALPSAAPSYWYLPYRRSPQNGERKSSTAATPMVHPEKSEQ